MNYKEAHKIIDDMDVEEMEHWERSLYHEEVEAILKGQRAIDSCMGRGEEGEDY